MLLLVERRAARPDSRGGFVVRHDDPACRDAALREFHAGDAPDLPEDRIKWVLQRTIETISLRRP
jgi:hypothetical protein